MVTCWSDVLGDCEGGQSEEHYVSEAIIGDGNVTIAGLPFLKGEVRTMPARRLTRNMLCVRHNRDLSPIDAAAGHFFRVIQAFMQRSVMRALGGRKRGGPDIYRVNGALLERWMLKTVVNIAFRPKRDGGGWTPPTSWVRCIHGFEAFPPDCGLYLLEGQSRAQPAEHGKLGLRILTASDEDPTIVGGQFLFQDVQLAVAMIPIRGGYRIRGLRDKPRLDLRQLIHFDWTDART